MHWFEPFLSVIVPARDEAANLPRLLDEIAAALAGLDYEVLVVDDGSIDATWDLLIGARGERSTAAPAAPRRERRARARRSGRPLRGRRGTWLATLDGDGQNDPADIPRLLARARARRCHPGGRPSPDAPRRLAEAVVVAGRQPGPLRAARRRNAGHRLRPQGDRAQRFPGLAVLRPHASLPAGAGAGTGRALRVGAGRAIGRGLPAESHYGVNNRLWVGLVDLVGVLWLAPPFAAAAPRSTMAEPSAARRDSAALAAGSWKIASTGNAALTPGSVRGARMGQAVTRAASRPRSAACLHGGEG